MPSRRGEKKAAASRTSSTKKIVAYALIGIVALGAVSVIAFSPRPAPINPEEESRQRALAEFQARFCGSSDARSTNFVTELELPGKCEMPLAIEYMDGKVWYVSTKNGTLTSYDVDEGRFGESHQVPSWPTRSGPTTWSMSWSAKADDNGNIWFTDERQRALWKFDTEQNAFSMFPVSARLPASIDFDSQGNLYFAGVQSSSIFIGETSSMRSGTSDGIREVALPLDGFAGIDTNLVSTGSLIVDRERNEVWVSLLAFQQKGQLFKYDIGADNVTKIVDLPGDVNSPVGIALDRAGDLWVTDHGTNIFFRYDPDTEEITKFVTSIASPRIYAGQDQQNAYTLPYWIERSPDTQLLWFNEHTGNKIASLDTENLVLTEYWIPSQNSNYVLCPPGGAGSCGLANALQIASAPQGKLWFSEWSENSIGFVDGDKQVPVSISVVQDELTVGRGQSAEIRVAVEASANFDGTMIASSTLTPNGRLGSSSGSFSESSVSIQSGSSRQISYTFTAAQDVEPGRYVIMVGAENGDVSVLKAVMINIV